MKTSLLVGALATAASAQSYYGGAYSPYGLVAPQAVPYARGGVLGGARRVRPQATLAVKNSFLTESEMMLPFLLDLGDAETMISRSNLKKLSYGSGTGPTAGIYQPLFTKWENEGNISSLGAMPWDPMDPGMNIWMNQGLVDGQMAPQLPFLMSRKKVNTPWTWTSQGPLAVQNYLKPANDDIFFDMWTNDLYGGSDAYANDLGSMMLAGRLGNPMMSGMMSPFLAVSQGLNGGITDQMAIQMMTGSPMFTGSML
jgi:hypothetical protein